MVLVHQAHRDLAELRETMSPLWLRLADPSWSGCLHDPKGEALVPDFRFTCGDSDDRVNRTREFRRGDVFTEPGEGKML